MPLLWRKTLLFLTTAAYLTGLVLVAPSGNPTVAVLAVVPLVLAGMFFGLRVSAVFAVGLLIAIFAVLELVGPGAGVILETYRGIPALMLVVVGVVVGRMRDLQVALESELETRRRVEAELRGTRGELEDMIDAKDELITSVGHELRTPLTAVLGFAEMLKIGNETGMPKADREEMVDFIAREAFDLSGIIDDLIVAARIEIGKLEVAQVPTALRAQTAQVLEGLDSEVVAGIRISGDEANALADPGRVRQILRNLITNALRYGGDNIEIVMSTDESTALLEVCDDGARLPEVEWERIFDPYYRYHAEASQPGSVGLGLTVARGLAELMNGTLTYRHHNGRSIFALRLPQSNGRSDHTKQPL
jgi:signal transduction histidine kinase